MDDAEAAQGHLEELRALRERVSELERQEKSYRSLFEDSPDAATVTRLADGLIVHANKRVEAATGFSPEELVGKERLHSFWVDTHGRAAMVQELREQHSVQGFAWDMRCRTGEVRRIETSGHLIDLDGEPCIVATHRDVTNRERVVRALRESEEALRVSEGRYRSLVEATLDWIWEIDLEGRHTYSNYRLESILGYGPEEFKAIRAFDLLHPDEVESVRRMWDECISTKSGWSNLEIRMRDRQGQYHYLESNATPILDPEGQVVGFRGVDRDMTEAVRDRAGRILLLFERKGLEEEITEVAARERQRIGHDLHDSIGQQLTGMGFLAKALEAKLRRHGRPEADEAAALKRQLTASLRETRLLSRSLLPLDPAAEDVPSALADLTSTLGEIFGVECRFVTDTGPWPFPQNAAADLFQIAREAVTNAVHHGKAGDVEVRLSRAEVGAVLTIVDDGNGFPEGGATGSGVGVRIMRYRAQRLGALLEISSSPGGGTVVEVVMPVQVGVS